MSSDIAVTLPDGSVQNHPSGVTIKQIAESIGPGLAKAAVGGVVDDGKKVIDVHTPLHNDCKLSIVTHKSEQGLEVLRHSTSHLMASAVQRLFPGTLVTFGPAVENGFFYDFHREQGFAPADFERIETEMRRIAAANVPFVREEVARDEAKKLFAGKGERFKVEHIDDIPEGETITLYRHDDWVDLCEGPHVPSTKFLKAFKLTSVAGAYWKGDERNPMLARIYGTAFWDKKALETHLHQVEEAKKRDHRRVGKDLDLFFFHALAPAMPFFTPKGSRVYNLLVDFARQYYPLTGFGEVLTPQVVDVELFKRSGHYANYKEDMFFSQIDEREFGVKPMNCPGHALIYANRKRSYRDLPIRYADFGRLHRYERSGVTAGLTRVRSFCQDDGHIFCREDQIGREIGAQVAMVRDLYSHFGLEMRMHFSTRPEVSIGREPETPAAERQEWDEVWHRAEVILQEAVDKVGLEYQFTPGDGAFYGPKIDFHVRDALGRWHQLGTIQLDFSMPRRFQLKYTNKEGGDSRPVMIHRAVFGSIERFIAILIEHTGGDLPVWLHPVQVRVLTLNDDLLGYGRKVAEAIDARGVRVALDQRSEKLGFKIRDAELAKIPFVCVLGKREQETGSASLRGRKKGDLGQMPLDRAIELVLEAAAVPAPGEALMNSGEREFGL